MSSARRPTSTARWAYGFVLNWLLLAGCGATFVCAAHVSVVSLA